ncbi:MAG TPA: 7TM diverse intracellular signaling domain-containing protein [Sphingobacteriaceae bacterium]
MYRRYLILLACVFIAHSAFTQVIITDSLNRVAIGDQVSVLKPGKEISFADAKSSADFVPVGQKVPNLGLSAVSYWLKFTVQNENHSGSIRLELAYPILDEVELYKPQTGNSFSKNLLSERQRFDLRRYKHPNYIFDLDIPKGTSKTYYLRIKSAEGLIVPLYISRPVNLWEKLVTENLVSGIFAGIVLIMFVYNLFVYFSVKDKSYLYYVFYVAFVGLTQIGIKGYTFQYLWPNSIWFQGKSVILFACMSGIGALLFTRKFLQTKLYAPKSTILLSVLIGLFLLACLITLSGYEQTGFQIMQGTTTLLTLLVLSVSFYVMRKGFAPAKFFFAAWSVLLTGAIVFLLKDYGILPYNSFTGYSMQAASALEMALLSFGLADRVNILKKEKEASQAEALRIAKENERIIREQNMTLERKVAERTAELKEANEELNTTLEDLKQAQTKLVESEKMASLGQLTAGIAHEINNPINFVTSNVTPLRRDVEMLLDTIAIVEEVGLSDASFDAKKEKINGYKEELDFDYLKIEIDHLLKGIHEGASRTAEIVKGLRIFSRVDEDDLKRADINEGLDSTLVIVNNLLNNRIEVIKEYGNLPLIECYPGKLNQVFLNIFSNAIHAINKKHGENAGGFVRIVTSHKENNVIVTILDNGIGMDEQTKKKIFEPFFTTKEVGEGTGLGMSIAYNTVKRHQGDIQVNSIAGEGTEFSLILPVIHVVQGIPVK